MKTTNQLKLLPDNQPLIIAGPCSAESEEQVLQTARALKKDHRVNLFRAGVWKPRTRPGSFEGQGSVALEWLQTVKSETGLPTSVEVANVKHVYQSLKRELTYYGLVRVQQPTLSQYKKLPML